jgi:Raf kinase inhibitor-like YbhB/YbcL family protein
MEFMHGVANLAGRLLRPSRERPEGTAGPERGPREHVLAVESASFSPGGTMPETLAGRNGRSPQLRWTGVPNDTAEIVILCEDPDAPMALPYVHWLVCGIPPYVQELNEGLPPTAMPLTSGVMQGRNSLGTDGYTGPSPPRGHGVHHYHFQIFALDRRLELHAPLTRDGVVDAMRGHVLSTGEVVGIYERE